MTIPWDALVLIGAIATITIAQLVFEVLFGSERE